MTQIFLFDLKLFVKANELSMMDVLPFVLVFAAASFIYIAVADLIPWMQRRADTESSAWQIVMVGSGVGFIALTHSFLH